MPKSAFAKLINIYLFRYNTSIYSPNDKQESKFSSLFLYKPKIHDQLPSVPRSPQLPIFLSESSYPFSSNQSSSLNCLATHPFMALPSFPRLSYRARAFFSFFYISLCFFTILIVVFFPAGVHSRAIPPPAPPGQGEADFDDHAPYRG